MKSRRRHGGLISVLLAAALFLCCYHDVKADDAGRATALQAMRTAAGFFHDEAGRDGAYVWAYSADMRVRKGEGGGAISDSIAWVQPPAGAGVGDAYLNAYEATGDAFYLKASKEVALALARGQLLSGGWYYSMELDPVRRRAWCYRGPEMSKAACAAIAGNKIKNETTLDDDTTQATLRFLMRIDSLPSGRETAIRDAINHGLQSLMRAQYPNGAWPVNLDRRVPTEGTTSAFRARYPEQWSWKSVKVTDPLFYALNDNIVRNMIHLFLAAYAYYGDKAFLATAMRAGDFLLAAQLPEPQPGWAQLYNADLEPIWDRSFEPPALASRETAGSVAALIELAGATGKERYLEAVTPAVRWLEKSRLPDGTWARYYELRTNRPLYVNSKNELTYASDDQLRHYVLRGTWDIPGILALGRASTGDGEDAPSVPVAGSDVAALESQAQKVVAAMDERGRWLEDGWVRTDTFGKNINILAAYLRATKSKP